MVALYIGTVITLGILFVYAIVRDFENDEQMKDRFFGKDNEIEEE